MTDNNKRRQPRFGPTEIARIEHDLNTGNTPRATQCTFRLHPSIDSTKAEMLLRQCYMWVVNDRGRRFIADDETRRHIERLAEWLVRPEGASFGVLLQGLMGNGKTTLMYAMQKLVGELGNYFGSFEHMGQYFRPGLLILHAKEIVDYCVNDKNFYEQLKNRDMLGIDDLGAEPAEVEQYRNVLKPITDLLEHRYQRRKFTIATTNLNARGLSEHYGARVADRMQEMFHRISFTNGSYRGKE